MRCKRMFVHGVCCAALLLGACASVDPDHAQGQRVPIAPFAAHETCRHLEPGDRWSYRFSASSPVSFSIHYRAGPAVISPIERDDVREDAAVFPSALAEDYCMTWQAGRSGALLDYDARVIRAPR